MPFLVAVQLIQMHLTTTTLQQILTLHSLIKIRILTKTLIILISTNNSTVITTWYKVVEEVMFLELMKEVYLVALKLKVVMDSLEIQMMDKYHLILIYLELNLTKIIILMPVEQECLEIQN